MIKNIISIVWTIIRFFIYKLFFWNKFSYGRIQRFSPNTGIEIGHKSRLSLGNKVRAHTGTKLCVRDNAILIIGNDVAFSNNCIITARKEIRIGDGCEIAPGVLIYDHDHEYRNYSIHEGLYRCTSVIIGKDVWIGANVIILRGAEIGDGCVIGAGTVVRKGKYPPHSLIYGVEELQVLPINGDE